MATVTRENIGTLHDKVIVKLEKQDYLPAFEKNLKEYAKKANIPGFRKGMVPAGMVRKMYGQSLFTDEIIRMAGKELEDFLKAAKVSIFAEPMVLGNQRLNFNMSAPETYEFNFEIGLKPEFPIPAVDNRATITRYKIAVDEKLVNDEIERICKQYGTEQAEEAIGADTHKVYYTIQPCDADGNHADESVAVENDQLIANVPEPLKALLQGKKNADEVIFHPESLCSGADLESLVKNILKTENADTATHYRMVIEKSVTLILATMNAELFEKVYPGRNVQTEEELRTMLAEELEREFARIARERMHDEIFEMLVHTTPIELPTTFLKRYLREGKDNNKTPEQVEQEYPGFEHQLRWQLISDKLMVKHNVYVTRDEVIAEIMTGVLRYFGITDIEDAPWLESYKAKIEKDEKAMNETYFRMLATRLFHAIEPDFEIVEKGISESEFFKMGSAHDAHHHH